MNKDEPIGITGIVVVRGEPEAGALVMTFIDKAHQGKGLSKMFYETRIQWAKERGLKRLYLIHAVGNQKVERAIRNLGFKFKENYWHEHHDGHKQECCKYVLELNISQ